MQVNTLVASAMALVGSLLVTSASADERAIALLLANYQKDDPVKGLTKFKTDYERVIRARATQSTPPTSAQARMSKAAPAAGKPEVSEKDNPAKPAVAVLIRQDFSDIWLFDNPTAVSSAKGASLSWTDDRILKDTTWSAHGMAAVALSVPGDYAKPGGVSVLGASLVGYVQVDKDVHSNQIKKNSDTWTGGFATEVGVDALGGSQFFRLSTAAVADRIADQSSVTAMFEWLPVYGDYCIGYPCAVPSLPVIYNFQPEFKVQYAHTTDSGALLEFSKRKDALRVGPEFTLLFKPFGPVLPFFSQLHGKITYHPWIEVVSGARQYWLDASLTYDIDKGHHLGLSGSYSRGNNETTGVLTDIYRIALTGKL